MTNEQEAKMRVYEALRVALEADKARVDWLEHICDMPGGMKIELQRWNLANEMWMSGVPLGDSDDQWRYLIYWGVKMGNYKSSTTSLRAAIDAARGIVVESATTQTPRPSSAPCMICEHVFDATMLTEVIVTAYLRDDLTNPGGRTFIFCTLCAVNLLTRNGSL